MASCVQCGSSMPDGAVFCGGCGARVGVAPTAPPSLPRDGTVPGSPLSSALAPGGVKTTEAAPLIEPTRPDAPKPADLPIAGAPKKQRHLPAGTVVDHKYSIERVLGEGGMGVVYLARDMNTGLEIVLKAVRPELAHRADVRERTLAEGRALARIDHPNVVHLNAVVVDDAGLWLVMQYIEGEPLDRTIRKLSEQGRAMPVAEALAVFRQIALGVGAAHRENIIHRDLKPANVLIRAKDRVAKVTDFGIAKSESDAAREHTKGIVGSLWYMSPEQVTGRRDLDARVDIYALGILLYQMLVGRVPFDADSDYEIMRMHAQTPMPRVREARPDVTQELDDLVQKCSAKDRANRFASCDDLIAAIDALSAKAPLPTSPGTIPSAPAASKEAPATGMSASSTVGAPAKGRSNALIVGVVATAFAGLGVLLVLLGVVPGLSRDPPPKPTSSATTATSAKVESKPSATASAPIAPTSATIASLAGTWTGNGRTLEAVVSGDVLELRVATPSEFAPQDYIAGEARFSLRASPEPNVFFVDDHLRPKPLANASFDPRSRSTCQEVWHDVGGEKLRARFDGTRISVELAKIDVEATNFVLDKQDKTKIVDCVGLAKLKAAKVVSVIERK
jgi:serine/threonine-protein kinase